MGKSIGTFWSEPLGHRELEILRLISDGYSNRDIAQKLFLSIETVKWYNKLLFSKLGASSRTQAVSIARQYDLLDAPLPSGKKEPIHLRHNLPHQLTSFIGREKEIAELVQWLAPVSSKSSAGSAIRTRLVTLTGPGGVGKTRLAVQAAIHLVGAFPDGVWKIDLAALDDPDLVPLAVAATLGLRDEGDKSMRINLTAHLQTKTALLLLDNCEHLIDACAHLSVSILQACPTVSILATSREAFRVSGEVPLAVAPLSVPDPGRSMSIESLKEYDAVRLFVERAQSSFTDFSLTSANSSAVTDVCCQLDGLPLAIELAAERMNVLTVAQIAERLDNRFYLLCHGSRIAMPHAQALQACMDRSYSLLSEAERILLARLAVFAGGWTLEAAEIVCEGGQLSARDVFALLAQLVEKSLVVVDRSQLSGLRYYFLKSIHRYALEKLMYSGENTALKDRHLDYYLGGSETAKFDGNGHGKLDGLNLTEADYENLRAAQEWSQSGDTSSLLIEKLGIFREQVTR